MGGLLELIIVVIIVGVIYQMFFSSKEMKQDDPREKKSPEYDKKEYVTPPKEKDSYTPEAPIGEKTIFAETPAFIDESQKKAELKMKDSILLGETTSSEDFFVTSKELNAMCLVVGATGAGKTECIKTILELALKNNHPIIIVDGKGDPKFPNEYAEACKKYNRNFKLFSCDINSSLHYNPLRHGLYTELKDKLIDIFEWSEEYFKIQAERFLQGVFKMLLLPETKELLGYEVIDLQILIKALSVEVMENLVPQIGEKANFMLSILAEADVKAVNGYCGKLKTIAESELGELFVDTQDANVIDLMESIENNDVVFFSLDSLKYSVYAQMLGRLVIADLKNVAPRFFEKGKEVYTVFDEFNVFASETVVNLINKTRSYGFRNIVATQELADMLIDGSNKLLDQIWGCTNVKIALRQDVFSSQEALSNGVGTKDTWKTTISNGKSINRKDESSNNGTSQTIEEEYIYKTREFGQLKIGEAIIFIKVPEFRHAKIKIRMVS
ncbi:TraM recognition domain-containing protein [Clostridium algidicarnis]|uniref:TraM recognition domain-containing protein n=1 Tax=Clostridium algidicarnis TaxID=37659 RepID=UPI003FD8915F